MQKKLQCCLVQDMLPLYIDGVISEKTSKEIREHIDKCTECRELEATMRTDVTGSEIEGLSDDIDGFKKINKKNKKKMGLTITLGICASILIAIIIIFNTFIKGEDIASSNLQVELLEVDNTTLSLEIKSKDSACGITDVKVEDNDGVITLKVKGAHKSPFSQGTVAINKEFKNTIEKIIVAEAVMFENGYIIEEDVRNIYSNKCKDLDDTKKLQNLIKAVNVKASYFKTDFVEVDTMDTQKVVLEASKYGNMTADNVEFYAQWFSYYMFACVEDLDTIIWKYKIDDKENTYTIHLSDAEKLLNVKDIKSFGETTPDIVRLEELILEGDIEEENKRYGFEEIEDGYAEGYQFALNEIRVDNNKLVIGGEHLYLGYTLGDTEIVEENGVVKIKVKIKEIEEELSVEGTPFTVKETFKNNITSVYLAGDIIYDQGNYITSSASSLYKYKVESVSDEEAIQKLVYGVTVGQRDGYSIFNVAVVNKDIQVKIRVNKDLFSDMQLKKSSPLILALAKDAESVTWFDKNGNKVYKATVKEIGTSIKKAGESAGALQEYMEATDVESLLWY